MKIKFQSLPLKLNCRGILLLASVLASLWAPFVTLAGPLSPLYLTDGDDNTLFVVKGANVINSWTIVNNAYAIAVTGSAVYTTVGASGFPGSQYSLSGAYVGASTFPNLPGTAVYDGASDGTHLYAWDEIQNRVLQFGPNWSNPQSLFSIGGSPADFMGITYDAANNSLWISGWNLSQIRDYSMTGQLLSSFSLPHNEITALALDPADGTLWAANRNQEGLLEQYSTSGQLLSTQSYVQLAGADILGGEFEVVPEPSAACFLLLGLLVIPWRVLKQKAVK